MIAVEHEAIEAAVKVERARRARDEAEPELEVAIASSVTCVPR